MIDALHYTCNVCCFNGNSPIVYVNTIVNKQTNKNNGIEYEKVIPDRNKDSAGFYNKWYINKWKELWMHTTFIFLWG